MDQDTLYLLRPEFADPAYPNRRFYCRDCALLEGLLASFRASTTRLDVQRIEWSRPRAPLVALLGAENQWLPVLILATDGQPYGGAREYAGHRFINDMTELLRALATRHGFPDPHP